MLWWWLLAISRKINRKWRFFHLKKDDFAEIACDFAIFTRKAWFLMGNSPVSTENVRELVIYIYMYICIYNVIIYCVVSCAHRCDCHAVRPHDLGKGRSTEFQNIWPFLNWKSQFSGTISAFLVAFSNRNFPGKDGPLLRNWQSSELSTDTHLNWPVCDHQRPASKIQHVLVYYYIYNIILLYI